MKKNKKVLREGFTTGTAATAAAMAALESLLCKEKGGKCMLTPVPPPLSPRMPSFAQSLVLSQKVMQLKRETTAGSESTQCMESTKNKGFLSIPIAGVHRNHAHSATAFVIKDGGDDPDATHKASIYATVTLGTRPQQQDIVIHGGEGVGRITLPGLPLPVGMAAINPAPRRQISLGLQLIAQKYAYTHSIDVTISVPGGEELAKNTFNPRLGILGGISILGTQGTVKPYSHKAWKATIVQGLEVAAATACTTLCLSTGRRSEKLLLETYPHVLPSWAIQAADFAEFSLSQAGRYPFEQLVWGCFFGKLVKLAQGHSYTHARSANLDFTLLQQWCAKKNMHIPEIASCVTANHALEYILAKEAWPSVLHSITKKAAKVASQFAQRPVTVHLFHLDGRPLACVSAR